VHSKHLRQSVRSQEGSASASHSPIQRHCAWSDARGRTVTNFEIDIVRRRVRVYLQSARGRRRIAGNTSDVGIWSELNHVGCCDARSCTGLTQLPTPAVVTLRYCPFEAGAAAGSVTV